MAKTASERIAKYKLKFDPTVVGSRFTAVKDLAGSKVEVKQTELTQIRNDIRVILNENGIDPLFTAPYLSFANKLYGLMESGATPEALQATAQAYAQVWIARGCNSTVINDILVYFGFSPLP